ncbi:uncharacterized protein LTR77_007187 [Saxophila tyrrhenica]|uniref:Beta-lactamase/transpeptidase-like protein n=1 Tax=Saxophila tyrrhenica TaxID=1690608 RepID=A0AAV9P4F6_9PEZI|nr:hypothetical protein LTR77_007187 [Saxophila tyrrhenica]
MDIINAPDFEDHVQEILDLLHTPGLAIAIIQDGNIESKAVGMASLEPPKPVTPDTLFDIASSSKSLTAACVALLVEDNERYPQVQWDSKVSSLLPDDFVMAEKRYTDDITVEDILCHRTGLPSHLIEKLTGQTFEDFLHQHILKPLGMTSTHLQPDAAIAAGLEERMAIQYTWVDEQLKAVPWMQTPEQQGCGSIFTSVNDYIKYVQAMTDRQHPFTNEIVTAVTTPRIIANPGEEINELGPRSSPTLYALGWENIWYRGHKVIQHNGLITGSGSLHFFVPDLNFGGVVLANSDTASSIGTVLVKEMLDLLIGIPVRERDEHVALERGKIEKEKEQLRGDALKKKIWPTFDGTTEPQKIPLASYTGEYWNAGYHGLRVQIKNEELFVDATDRSDGFVLQFEHVRGQTMYVAHLATRCGDVELEPEELEAEFRFDNDRVVKMGINLEFVLEDKIWFDRVIRPSSRESSRAGEAFTWV